MLNFNKGEVAENVRMKIIDKLDRYICHLKGERKVRINKESSLAVLVGLFLFSFLSKHCAKFLLFTLIIQYVK